MILSIMIKWILDWQTSCMFNHNRAQDLHQLCSGGTEPQSVHAAEEAQGNAHMVSSNLAATKGSQAMLEAAVSSAICHPNIVQTYDYQVVDTYQSATVLRTEANRVS